LTFQRKYFEKDGEMKQRSTPVLPSRKPKQEALGIFYDGAQAIQHVTRAMNRMLRFNHLCPGLRVEVKVASPETYEASIQALRESGCTKIIWCLEALPENFDYESAFRFLGKSKLLIYNSPETKRFVAEAKKYPDLSLLHFDRKSGFKKMAARLKKLGHRKVCAPQIKASDPTAASRLINLAEWGIETVFIHPESIPYLLVERYQTELVEPVIRSLKRDGVTAAVFWDDRLALKVLNGLMERGIEVPSQVGVVSMGGEEWLPLLQKPLETFGFPIDAAMSLIQEVFFGKKKSGFYSLEMESLPGKTLAVAKR
jgi:hypothetical protein